MRDFEIKVSRHGRAGQVYVDGSGTGEDFETAAAAIVLALVKMVNKSGGYEPPDILHEVLDFVIDYVADNLDATFVGDMAMVDERMVKELDRMITKEEAEDA